MQALDDLLGGGISPGCITELVGPAGIGKSQLCLMLAISSLLPHISTNPPTVSLNGRPAIAVQVWACKEAG